MNSSASVAYPVQIEVAGPLAMFARPDTGVTPTSYPVPSWSACKGLFESIAMLSDGQAWICPTKVEVCKRRGSTGGVHFQRYTTNYGGPLRKANLVSDGSGMQLFATVLSNVCYRLYGEVRGSAEDDGANRRHYLQDLFNRRLKQGRCFRTPCLGWSEFTCSYWGGFRDDEYEVDEMFEDTISSMLVSVWSHPVTGRFEPRFAQGVKIEQGVLRFAE